MYAYSSERLLSCSLIECEKTLYNPNALASVSREEWNNIQSYSTMFLMQSTKNRQGIYFLNVTPIASLLVVAR